MIPVHDKGIPRNRIQYTLEGQTGITIYRIFLAAILLIVVFGCPALASSISESEKGQIYQEVPLPSPRIQPLGIVVDHKGTVWFAGSISNGIYAYDPESREFRDYLIPNNNTRCEVWGLAVDKAGQIWFGDTVSNAIWVLDTGKGVFRSYPIPTPDSYPFQLDFDPSGTLWFTELYGGKIGQLNTEQGIIKEYQPPSLSAGLSGFDFDNNGTIWFTEEYTGFLGSFNPQTGDFREYPLIAARFRPRGVVVDHGGKIWIGNSDSSTIVLFDPSRNDTRAYTTSMATYAEESTPYLLKKDYRGNIWLNERMGNRIARIDPSSMSMVEVELPYSPTSDLPDYRPPPCCKIPAGLPVVPREILAIAVAENGDLWFTEALGNRIGVVFADYNPPIRFTLTSIKDGEAVHEKRLEFTLQSFLTDPSDLRIRYHHPPLDGYMTVGPLWVNPADIRQNEPLVIPVVIEVARPDLFEDLTITVSAEVEPVTVSQLVDLSGGEMGHPVPTSTPLAGSANTILQSVLVILLGTLLLKKR